MKLLGKTVWCSFYSATNGEIPHRLFYFPQCADVLTAYMFRARLWSCRTRFSDTGCQSEQSCMWVLIASGQVQTNYLKILLDKGD